MNPASLKSARRGFTLVELLVVIGIIALLISILLPSLNQARSSAKKVVCLSNLRSATQGIMLYTNAYDGYLPGSPNTSGAGVREPGITANNLPVRISTWDYLTPVATMLGIDYNEGPTLDDRVDRYDTLINDGVFVCPENEGVQATAFRTPDRGPRKWISYNMGMAFLFKTPPIAYNQNVDGDVGGITNNPIFGGTPAVGLPGGYAPRITKIGSSTRKVALADGGRYIRGTLPTYNLSPVSPLGGDFADWGPWSPFGNGFSRAGAPANTTTGQFDSRLLWARHGGSDQPGLPGGKYSSNYAFYDGHAETLDDLAGSNPVLWTPKDSLISTGQTYPDSEAAFINGLYENGAYVVPE